MLNKPYNTIYQIHLSKQRLDESVLSKHQTIHYLYELTGHPLNHCKYIIASTPCIIHITEDQKEALEVNQALKKTGASSYYKAVNRNQYRSVLEIKDALRTLSEKAVWGYETPITEDTVDWSTLYALAEILNIPTNHLNIC